MRQVFLVVVVLFSVGLPAQQPAQAAPARVCVAQVRNQTPNKFDEVQFRQLFIDELKKSKPAQSGEILIVPIEASESDDAQEVLQKESCRFAVYTRLLQQPHEPDQLESQGTITYKSRREEPKEVMGVQCTVENATSGMPVLIDRQFNKMAQVPKDGAQKIIVAEAGRVSAALEKKLSTTPK